MPEQGALRPEQLDGARRRASEFLDPSRQRDEPCGDEGSCEFGHIRRELADGSFHIGFDGLPSSATCCAKPANDLISASSRSVSDAPTLSWDAIGIRSLRPCVATRSRYVAVSTTGESSGKWSPYHSRRRSTIAFSCS